MKEDIFVCRDCEDFNGNWISLSLHLRHSCSMSNSEIKEELSKGIKLLFDKVDGTPTSTDIRNCSLFSTHTIMKQFGSINEAMDYCGLDRNAEWGKDDEYYIKVVEQLAEEINSSPTANDIREKTNVSVTEIQRRWGSLNNFKKELSMDICPPSPTKEEWYREDGYWPAGEEHPLYGLPMEEAPVYVPNKPKEVKEIKKHRKWARNVKERDKHECQECGSDEEEIYFAHHIKKKREYPDLAFDIDNGVTLCAYCHAEKHKDDEGKYKSLSGLADKIEKEGNIYK